MYRTFLSWRYMRSRRTNWIGISGIFVGVGALILILSIMTGFLEETRRTIRGSLSDLLITPRRSPVDDGEVGRDPGPLLDELRADPRVEAACAQLVWFGLFLREDGETSRLLSDPMFSQRVGVKLVGIDVADEFA